MMFCSSLPPVVCRRANVLLTLFVSYKVQFFVGVLFSWISRKSRDFNRDVTFTRVLAVTRKWNVAGVYLYLLYNMRSKQGDLLIIASQLWFFLNFTITKFCLCLIIQKSSFCSQNSNVYICQHACVFLVTVQRHTTLRPMLFLWFPWP